MNNSLNRVFGMKFANVYPLYVQKVERKNHTKEEVDQIISWLTGYNQAELKQQIKQENDLETFFSQAPAINPNSVLIKGVVCGVRVEEIKDPLMQKIRYLDKLIDELAKGKAMEKICGNKWLRRMNSSRLGEMPPTAAAPAILKHKTRSRTFCFFRDSITF